ncbi:MAG: hypothetical protein IJV45_00795 [Prevotella sp.]|nr:hypothetical protein [Prevotella sp.]
MAKKVVYSLLALSAVPAANANAAAVALPAQGTQVQGEMTAAAVQDVYQVQADKSDFKDVLNGIHNKLNAGVLELEDMLNQLSDFDSRVDADQLAALEQLLKDSKVEVGAIDQDLDPIREKDECTDEEYLAISKPDNENEYIIKLNEILEKARAAFNALKAQSDNIVANDANQADAQELKDALDELKGMTVNDPDEEIKSDIDKDINAVEKLVNDFKEAADKAFEDGTATEFEPDPSKDDILKEIQNVVDEINAVNTNYDAYQEVKQKVEETKAEYNKVTDQLQKDLLADDAPEAYADLLKEAQKELANGSQEVVKVNDKNEEFYANQEYVADETGAVVKKDSLLNVLSELNPKAIVDKVNALKDAIDAAAKLQENLDAVELKDEFINKADLEADKQAIQDDIDALNEEIKNAITDPETDKNYSVEEKAGKIQEAIDALVGKVEAAQKAADENKAANDEVVAKIEDLQSMLDKAVNELYDEDDNAKLYEVDKVEVPGRYTNLIKDLQDQIDDLEKAAEEANEKGKAAEFLASYNDRELRAAIEEFDAQSDAALDNYNEVEAKLAQLDDKMAELQGVIDGLTIDKTDYQTDADKLAGDLQGAKDDIANILKEEGKQHYDDMAGYNAPDATDGKTALDNLEEAIDELIDKAKADQAQYDADQYHEGRIALSNEILDRLEVFEKKLAEAGEELNDPNAKDALGASYEDLKKQLGDIIAALGENNEATASDAKDATLYDKFNYFKEYEPREKNLETNDMRAFSELTLINNALIELGGQIDDLLQAVKDAKEKVQKNNEALANLSLDELKEHYNEVNKDLNDPEKYDSAITEHFAQDMTDTRGDIEALEKEINDLYDKEELADNEEVEKGKITDIWNKIDSIAGAADQAQANLDLINELQKALDELNARIADFDGEIEEADKPYLGAVDFFKGKVADNKGLLDSAGESIKLLDPFDFDKDEYDNAKQNIDDVTVNLDKLIGDVKSNVENYDKLLNGVDDESGEVVSYGKYDVQDLWNEKFTEINGNPESETKEAWLEKLDDIQTEINQLAKDLNEAYENGMLSQEEGQSNAKVDELQAKINELINKLNNITEGYDEEIAKENKAMDDAFQSALAALNEAYKKAVEEIDSYRTVKNEDLLKQIEEVVLEYHDMFYMIDEFGNVADNKDTYRQQIEDLKLAEGKAFAEIVSPNKLSSEFEIKANELTAEINGKVDDLHNDVKAIVEKYWADLKADFEKKLDDAKKVIEDYSEEAKEGAFSDVETLIDECDDLVGGSTAAEINQLGDKLTELADIDNMLKKDKNEAAKKDIDPRVQAAKDLYEEAKAKLTGEALDELNTLYDNTVKKAENLENQRYKKETLPGARAQILKYLEEFTTGANKIVEDYEKAQKDAKDLADAKDELNKKIDEAIEDLKEFLDGDDDIADLEAIRDKIADMELADKEDLVTEIDSKVTESIREERDIIKGKLEELQEEYNRFASSNPDKAEEAAEMRALIEQARAEANKATAANTDEDREAVKAAEKALAELNSKLKEGADEAAQEDLNNKVADLFDKLAELEGISDEVKEQFKDEIDEVTEAVKDLDETVNDLDNADFYKEKIEKEIAEVAKEVEDLVNEVKDAQKAFDANNDAYDRLIAELDELSKAVEDARETVADYDTFNKDATLNGYDKKISTERTKVEKDHTDGKLTAESQLSDEVKAIKDNVAELVNNAAFAESEASIKTAADALDEVRTSLSEKDYAGSVWKEIQDEITEIGKSIESLNKDNSTAKTNGNAAELVSDIKAKVAELIERIDALKTKVNTNKAGDANHDGRITMADYYTVLDIITAKEKPEPGEDGFVEADVNGDGTINIADATAVANLVLYGNVDGVLKARAAQNVEEKVYVEAAQNADGTVRLALNLTNGRAYTGMQMDVILPEGMNIVAKTAGQRAENHAIYTGEFDGMTRIVVANDHNAELAGNNGAVVYIDIEGAGSLDQIEFQNVFFAETNAQLTQFTVGAAEATGINAVESDSLMDKVYNMGGRVMNAVKKGINIIKGNDGQTKKVVVK